MRRRKGAAFLDRIEATTALRDKAWRLGCSTCIHQKHFGDFHLKTTLAIVAANAIQMAVALDRKLAALPFGVSIPDLGNASSELRGRKRTQGERLREIATSLGRLIAEGKGLASSILPYADITLTRTLSEHLRLFGSDLAILTDWIEIGPTRARDLASSQGLLRDCDLFEHAPRTRTGRRPRALRDMELRNPLLRACYLSANAYLEITAIDIVSDLIVRAEGMTSADRVRFISDLSFQLLDEARHAELLATRVDDLGFGLGIAPVSLHTWVAYNSVKSIAERLIVQQVLQEGVGLDSSAGNILRMLAAGDSATSNVYAQITADEGNHVALGTRWATKYDRRPLSLMIEQVGQILDRIDPLPSEPVVVELREKAGYPVDLIEREASEKGRLSLSAIHAAANLARRHNRSPRPG